MLILILGFFMFIYSLLGIMVFFESFIDCRGIYKPTKIGKYSGLFLFGRAGQ